MLNDLRISLVAILLWLHEQLTIFILWIAEKELKNYQEYYEIQKAEQLAGVDFAQEIPPEFRDCIKHLDLNWRGRDHQQI